MFASHLLRYSDDSPNRPFKPTDLVYCGLQDNLRNLRRLSGYVTLGQDRPIAARIRSHFAQLTKPRSHSIVSREYCHERRAHPHYRRFSSGKPVVCNVRDAEYDDPATGRTPIRTSFKRKRVKSPSQVHRLISSSPGMKAGQNSNRHADPRSESGYSGWVG